MKPLALFFVLSPSLALALPKSSFDGGANDAPSLSDVPAPAPAQAAPVDGDPRLWVVVDAADRGARNRVVSAGVSIEQVLPGQVGGVATPQEVSALKRMGFTIRSAVSLARHFRIEEFPAGDKAFHAYGQTIAELNAIAAKAQGLASLFSIGQTLQGRDIAGIRLNTTESGTAPSAKPGIVFMGNHHAREHLSNEVPLLLAKYLVENRDKPEIASLLNSRDIYIIPMINPDGAEYDTTGESYHMHRKNMRNNADGSTGVDLNRNYGGPGWGGEGSSDDPQSDIYHGPSAFSEPETQAVKSFVDGHPNLKVLLTYHTFSELILYPWGHTNSPISDGKALAAYKAMAQTMAGWTGYTPEAASDLYLASGDTCDWSWDAHKIFSFTFELTPKSMWEGGFYPGAAAIATTFQANVKPALYLIGLADNPWRAGETSASLTAAGTNDNSGGK